MRLEQMFSSDINREINGVVKVNDEQHITQELNEYIITHEIRRHFNTFLNHYEKSLNQPTDQIGVWISGFFGSGKSHFLKILSILLSNRTVAGKRAVDYFADKFDDPMMFAQLERCAAVPTDAILFNIDAKSPINKDSTAILRVFAKVFYEYRGFYGDDLKVARLEQFIDQSGKTEEFRRKFAEIRGTSWEVARSTFAFLEDSLVDVLTDVLGMSESAVRNWFNGTQTEELSIEQLVREIKAYIDTKGSDFRLLFMVDEVGQYIGSDGNLMLNLQTIVEEIGSKCAGRVWVMVTSQEAIDSVTKIQGNDFSKIQGRFNIRLSLSSSSVDEVIKKRILAKTDTAQQLLAQNYSKNSAVMKNLFTFTDAVKDLKGYSGDYEYVDTYPFVPYQFKLMQNVLAQIRKHGNSGKHLSGGERSMLSAFQDAAVAIEDRDESAFVPFSLFYDTIVTFLEGNIRRVIDRCQAAADNRDGIEPYDVSILKLLYLIRYVDDVRANVDNIVTLMTDDIQTDKIDMRIAVQASLDRLRSQNYIVRNGDTYTFLTDDEQDVEREIRNTPVNSANITRKIAESIFNNLYAFKKFRYGRTDFPFDAFVDDTAFGQPAGGLKLRILTEMSDLYRSGDERLRMQSDHNNEAILVLSDVYPYFDDLENAAKIRQYIKGRNMVQLPQGIREIIQAKEKQAETAEKRASQFIERAITEGKVYVCGDGPRKKGSSVKEKIDDALSVLVETIYTKLNFIRQYADSDSDLIQILNDPNPQAVIEGAAQEINPEAQEAVERYLELQAARMLPTSMGDIQRRFSGVPYGWREIDIAAVTARLIAKRKVTVRYAGNTVQPTDSRLPDLLRRKSEIDKTTVIRRVAIPASLIKDAREVLKEFLGTMDVPMDEDGLISFVLDRFTEAQNRLQTLLDTEYRTPKYPDKALVEQGVALCDEILFQKKDNTALLKKTVELRDDLQAFREDAENLRSFFGTQKPVFDSAYALASAMENEREYLREEPQALSALADMKAILSSPSPYRRISELPALMQNIQAVYGRLLQNKREEIFRDIREAQAEIARSAGTDRAEFAARTDAEWEAKRKAADAADTLTGLDAMKTQIAGIREQTLKALIAKADPEKDTVAVSRNGLCLAAKLENEADVDRYLTQMKEKLMGLLEGHDALHIL